jgi:aminopeptidase N
MPFRGDHPAGRRTRCMPRCMPRCGVACVLLFALLAAGTLRAQDFRRRERTFDVLHYRIDVRFDEAVHRVIGAADVTLRPLRDSCCSIELDAVAMSIRRVGLAGGAELRFEYDSARLRVLLDRPYAYGEKLTVAVQYSCTPARGLYFIQPNASYPGDPEQIWTQGQGEDNRHWFPCYDYPNDKASSELIVRVRDEWVTLGNGALASKKKNGDGTSTWRWVQDAPHSSYLIMLAAGRFRVYRDRWESIPVDSYYAPTDALPDVKRAYEHTAAMVGFFSRFTGIRYPWPKYAQIPVAHFLYGGMENTTATVLADSRVVLDARASLDYTPDGLIAHELAHQWWGDDVTYADWENAWLNEGFATCFQQLWTEHAHGADLFAEQRFEGMQSYLDWTDKQGRIPLVSAGPNGSPNHYSKGAAVLHMLRVMIGDAEFRRVLRAYGERHAFGSVETNDLKRAIEDVTGRNLRWFFEQWVLKAGYPELRVRKEWDADSRRLRLICSQTQHRDSLCGYFRFPMEVWIATRSDTLQRTVWVDSATTVAEFALAAEPLLVSVDHGSAICGRITLEQDAAGQLATFLGNPDPVKRIGAALALLPQLALDSLRRPFFARLPEDPSSFVRVRVAAALAALRPVPGSYRREWRDLLLRLSGDARSGVRANAVNALGGLRDSTLRPLFEARLRDSSYHVEAAALACLAGIDAQHARAEVEARLAAPSYRDIVAVAAMRVAVEYRLRGLEPALMRCAQPGGSQELRTEAVTTLLGLGAAADTLLPLLRGMLEEPAREFRMFAATLLARAFRADARPLLQARLARETDKAVRKQLDALLAGGQ